MIGLWQACRVLGMENAKMNIRRLRVEDAPWVAEIFAANARGRLSEEQRRESGFVQGRLDAEMIRGRVEGPASVVALIGEVGVGAILTADAGSFTQGPPGLAVEAARKAGIEDFFLYGPGVVAEGFRSRGILRAMKDELIELARVANAGQGNASRRYRWAIGFVEHSNAASMAAHAKTGWQSVATFEFQSRAYDVIAHPVPSVN